MHQFLLHVDGIGGFVIEMPSVMQNWLEKITMARGK